MAVPTISDVSPDTGPSRGYNLVTITGTNFRVRTVGYSIPAAVYDPPCAVTVGGRSAYKVFVRSSTEIVALAPAWRGTAQDTSITAVDVVVTNLDDTGMPIGGETVTSSGAYTYERQKLRLPQGPPAFLQVLDEFIRLLQREIVTEVGWMAHSDYGRSGETTTVVQTHPALTFRVDMVKDPDAYGQEDNVWQYKDVGGGVYEAYRPPETYMMVFDLVASAQNPIEAMHLIDGVVETWKVTQELEVDADPDWAPGTTNKYPLEMPGDPVQASSPNSSDVTAFACQLRVRGIPVLADEPVREVYEISTIYLGYGHMDGTTFEESEVP